MIIDRLDHAHLYYCLGERFEKAFKYLQEYDVAKYESGDYEIEGRDLYMRVKRYDSFPFMQCKLEKHQKYAEFHVCLSGKEWFCYNSDDKLRLVESVPENDVYYYEGNTEPFVLTGDSFALVFPHEGHLPERAVEEIVEPVTKVVMKIRIG